MDGSGESRRMGGEGGKWSEESGYRTRGGNFQAFPGTKQGVRGFVELARSQGGGKESMGI